MADKPKDDKSKSKAAPAPTESMESKLLAVLGVFVLIFLIVIPAVLSSFNLDTGAILNLTSIKESFISIVSTIFTTLTFIAIFLTLVFSLAIVYLNSRKDRAVKEWSDSQNLLTMKKLSGMGSSIAPGLEQAGVMINGMNLPGVVLPEGTLEGVRGPQAEAGNEQWQDIEGKINSANPADWRLAILEADILLQSMLEQMGLPGQTLGEKLKSADPSFFGTIQEAWNAHKIRNIIAHQGSSYNLTYNEARRAIDLYRRVFEEFYFI